MLYKTQLFISGTVLVFLMGVLSNGFCLTYSSGVKGCLCCWKYRTGDSVRNKLIFELLKFKLLGITLSSKNVVTTFVATVLLGFLSQTLFVAIPSCNYSFLNLYMYTNIYIYINPLLERRFTEKVEYIPPEMYSK